MTKFLQNQLSPGSWYRNCVAKPPEWAPPPRSFSVFHRSASPKSCLYVLFLILLFLCISSNQTFLPPLYNYFSRAFRIPGCQIQLSILSSHSCMTSGQPNELITWSYGDTSLLDFQNTTLSWKWYLPRYHFPSASPTLLLFPDLSTLVISSSLTALRSILCWSLLNLCIQLRLLPWILDIYSTASVLLISVYSNQFF